MPGEDLGPYRSVLAHPPSLSTFRRLSSLLGDAERAPDDPVVSYLSDHLRSWPDEVARPARRAWLTRAVYEGLPVPQLTLCNALFHEAFECGFGREDFEELARCHPGVRHIGLEAFTMGRDDVELIAGWSGEGLNSLRLGFSGLDDTALAVIARSPHMESLRVLDVRHDGLSDLGVLAGTPLLRGLKSLRAQRNRITGEGLTEFLSCEYVASIERLDLRYNPLGERGARELAGLSLIHI